MNPYQTPPRAERSSDSTGRPTVESSDELKKRQMRLVLRLGILSVVTTVAAVVTFLVTGFEPTTTAVLIALILGIGFTVSWRA